MGRVYDVGVEEKDESKNCLKGTVDRMAPECEEQRNQLQRGGRRGRDSEGGDRGGRAGSRSRWHVALRVGGLQHELVGLGRGWGASQMVA